MQAADERRHFLESERNARADAERAGAMKDEFLATLSHELRTPLSHVPTPVESSELVTTVASVSGRLAEGELQRLDPVRYLNDRTPGGRPPPQRRPAATRRL